MSKVNHQMPARRSLGEGGSNVHRGFTPTPKKSSFCFSKFRNSLFPLFFVNEHTYYRSNYCQNKNNDFLWCRGFTLIEIIIALAIIILISSFSYLAFVNLNKSQVLERNASTVVSILEEARSLSVSGKGPSPSRYGVHFERAGNEVVLFTGDSFNPANPNNKETLLHSSLVISEVNLESNRDEIVFSRLRGETEDYGSVVLSLVGDSEMIETIAVYPTGVVQKIN